jgi:signal transduction histidine kinase
MNRPDEPEGDASDADRLASIGLRTAGLFHDLRSQCNVISGCAELMARTDDARDRMEYLDQIWVQLDALTTMADEVLAFARGDRSVFPRKVYLNRFMDQMAGKLIDQLAGSQIALQFDAQYLGIAYFDEPKMMRVFDNLVRNASEAMGGRGDLRLATRADDAALYFELSDNGPGIPSDLTERLFDPFTTSKESGTGLGLAICKTIVEEHRGDIWVDTAAERGTTFTVRLPRQM